MQSVWYTHTYSDVAHHMQADAQGWKRRICLLHTPPRLIVALQATHCTHAHIGGSNEGVPHIPHEVQGLQAPSPTSPHPTMQTHIII